MKFWGKSMQVEGMAHTKSLMWDNFSMPGGETYIKVATQRDGQRDMVKYGLTEARSWRTWGAG